MRLPSDLDLGIVLAARTIALVASLLLGGVVADRAGRRMVMVSADLVRLMVWIDRAAARRICADRPLATGLGVSAALYLCGGLEIIALAPLTIRDIRTLTPRPRQPTAAIEAHKRRDPLDEGVIAASNRGRGSARGQPGAIMTAAISRPRCPGSSSRRERRP